MLTFFTTPKAFRGNLAITQRNAIASWKQLHPEVEVIVFGNEEGAAEAANEFDARFERDVPCNEFHTPYLNAIFDRAQETARHDLLCYINCDIVLTADFKDAFERATAWRNQFLMVGRRWDTDVTDALDFGQPDWQTRIRQRALAANRQRPAQFIDYFAFRRGLFQGKIPPFAAGRPGFDNWLIWFAGASGASVIDASPVVVAVHQNHDHSHVPKGEQGFWYGEEARWNSQFLDDGRRFARIDDAAYRLTRSGIGANHYRWIARSRRAAARAVNNAWFALLNRTRSIRHAIGLKQSKVAASRAKD
jgi:hypothetical protein